MEKLQVALIIPSLDPDEKIVRIVGDAIEAGFPLVILVDDGSSEEHKHYFQELKERYGQVVLLTHPVNLGKGEGLKTAFRYYKENCIDKLSGFITADGDGQHCTKDIVNCAKKMLETESIVFGCRDFSLPDVPARSRFGNHFTSGVFRLICGKKLSDTQTGLRAFPNSCVDDLLNVAGSRFEYETNMILDMHRLKLSLVEVKIETVYEEKNSCSHFRPVRDSMKIYKLIFSYLVKHHFGFKYIFSSFSSFLVDILFNFIFLECISSIFHEGFIHNQKVIIALFAARIISSLFNFMMNRNYVFRQKGNIGKAMAKYYTVCIPQSLLNAFFVKLLVWCFKLSNHGLIVCMNLITQVSLFIISFFIQKKWVFKKKKTNNSNVHE